MEWFKKKMRVFLFVCLLFPFYSYAAKISLSISGKIEDHSAMLYFPDGRELPISIDASGKGELVVDVTEPVYVLCGELLGVLISRILRLYYIDVAFVWLGGIMLWLWYWFGVQPSYMG